MAQQTSPPATASAPERRRPGWALPAVIVALVVIAVAFVIGFTGLFANPVKSTNADGSATLSGTFEPYQCDTTSCNGYIQAGARSVFVQFPPKCAPPQRGSQITVTAKRAPDLGNAAYRATSCV